MTFRTGLFAQNEGFQRFFINGTEIDFNLPVNEVLYLNDPCSEYTLCIQYDNWEDIEKDGAFVLNLPKGIFEIIDPGGFQITDDEIVIELTCEFEVDGTDPEAEEFSFAMCCITIRQVSRGSILPILLGSAYQFLNTLIINPDTESYAENPGLLTSPAVFVGLQGQTSLISDLMAQDFAVAELCDPNAGPYGVVVSGNIELDDDFCLIKVSQTYGNGDVIMRPHSKFVLNSDKEFLIDRSSLVGCDELWESIVLEPGARLWTMESTIEDGLYPVFIEYNSDDNNPTIISLDNSTFYNNLIPVASEVPLLNTDLSAVLLFSNNVKYETVNAIKPFSPLGYAGGDQRGFAAMSLSHISYTSILGDVLSNQAEIRKFYDGILSDQGGLIWVKDALISDIISGTTGGGYGILSQSPTANLVIEDSVLDEMEYGVSSAGGHLSMKRNALTEIDRVGIEYTALDKRLSVMENEISTDFRGIQVNHSRPVFQSGISPRISSNVIDVTNSKSLPNAGGVFIGNVMNQTGNYSVMLHDNTISTDRSRYGVLSNASEEVQVMENILNLSDVQSFGDGIRMNEGSFHSVYGNSVQRDASPNAGTDQSGIWVSAVGTSDVSCNEVYNHQRGIFYEQSNQMHDVKGNYMANTNVVGLRYDNNATTGNQFHKGNLFQSKGNVQQFEAIHVGVDNIVEQSIFRVDQASNSVFMPNWSAPSAPNTIWFQNLSNSSTFSCNQEFYRNAEGEPQATYMRSMENRLSALDMTLEGPWLLGLEGETQRHIGIRQLLSDIGEYPLAAQGEDLDGWLRFADATEAGQVHALWSDFAQAGTWSQEEAVEIDRMMEAIHEAETAFHQAIQTCDSTLSCRIFVIQKSVDLLQALRNYEKLIQEKEAEKEQGMRDLNPGLSSFQETAALLDQELVSYLSDIALGEASYRAGELDSRLMEISLLCPNLFGPAVYRARALVMDREIPLVWDDLHCIAAEERKAKKENELADEQNAMKVYPSLTQSKLFIGQAERIQVIHPYQGIILDRPVSNLEELNTSSWLPAMYWIRVTDTEGFIRTFKIVKF